MYPDCQLNLKPFPHDLGIPEPIPPSKSDKTYESCLSFAEGKADEMYVVNVEDVSGGKKVKCKGWP